MVDPNGEETRFAIREHQRNLALLNGDISEDEYRAAQVAEGTGALIGASFFIPGPEDLIFAGVAGKAATQVFGHAQKTLFKGAPSGHAFRSAREAFSMVQSGKFASVHMNRTLNSITKGDINSKLKPDVAGVRPDGKIDITETLSPGQSAAKLEAKYSAALGNRMGDFTAVKATKQVCTGSRIGKEGPC